MSFCKILRQNCMLIMPEGYQFVTQPRESSGGWEGALVDSPLANANHGVFGNGASLARPRRRGTA
jgi:hypothetical protein